MREMWIADCGLKEATESTFSVSYRCTTAITIPEYLSASKGD